MIIKCKQWLLALYYSFAVQLVLLHFKKHQLILIYWVLLFATIDGSFMKMFGAYSLFLAPEYLDTVNGAGAAMVGMAVGVFIMAWNITTFILHSKHIKFLATANNPFLIYCLNNCVIPIIFLLYYMTKAVQYGLYKELFSQAKIMELALGFLAGLLLNFCISFLYFFKANSNIKKIIAPILKMPYEVASHNIHHTQATTPSNLLQARTYLTNVHKLVVVRTVKHYNKLYIDTVFKRHHLASVLLIILAFLFLVAISFFLDNPYFQIPAAASITILFAILLSVFGALAYFLQNWSLPFAIALLVLLNVLYTHQIIDPTNKAYGLSYANPHLRPLYNDSTINALCTPYHIQQDKANMIAILNAWKSKQDNTKPVLYIINVSGGGNRSAAFTMHTLQAIDSVLQGTLMQRTFMMHGASGGMLGAAYYRALYAQQKDIKAQAGAITDNPINHLTKDLLNPIFSSFVARDLISPAHKFYWKGKPYLKDRAYSFEEKLNTNTDGLLNCSIGDYATAEKQANMPLMIYSSVVLRDARKMLISTQPISFLMKPYTSTPNNYTPDAIDFGAFFSNQQPMDLRVLTALRMNASFPYVLPTVWLPSNPIIDVMDAGIKDNYGQELTTRFITVCKDWLQLNTSKVVIISIRDRKVGNWDMPFEQNNILGAVTKPVGQVQFNIFKMQDYNQNEQLNTLLQWYGPGLNKVTFSYAPNNEENHAALSFHLTNKEKIWIKEDVQSPHNVQGLQYIKKSILTQ